MKTSPWKLLSIMRLALAASSIAALPGCHTVDTGHPKPTNAELKRQLAGSQETARRYEARYGKLLPERPRHEFRKLRAQLKGKPMSEVAALLGKPAEVYTSGSTESWDYVNAAYDSASGRTVRRLEIWFGKGVVEYLKAVF